MKTLHEKLFLHSSLTKSLHLSFPISKMARLSFLLLFFSACFISAHGACTCNDIVSDPVTPSSDSNLVNKLTSILLQLLPGSPGAPQRLAVVTGSIFEAYSVNGAISHESLADTCASLAHVSVSVEETVAYAAYAAMRLVFSSEASKLKLLDGHFVSLGYDPTIVSSHVGAVIARGVAMKFKLSAAFPFMSANAASSSFDASCDTLTRADQWQAQCVQPAAGMACKPQMVMFTPFFNASYITTTDPVSSIVDKLPAPPMYDGDLAELPAEMGMNDFADQHLAVMEASATLGDYSKTLAETFAPNIALQLFNRALHEAELRKLNATQSATLFFALGAAVRDALVTSVTAKIKHNSVRPVTVIQCAYAQSNASRWRGPYKGVGGVQESEDLWRPYLQTPGFPGYISGHSAVAAAGARVLGRFFEGEKPMSANCHVTKKGMSMVEPMILKGAPGYVKDVTDVPNKGRESVGYSPAKDVTVCWNSWGQFAKMVAMSRLAGGIHIPMDNDKGNEVGEMVGDMAYKFVVGAMGA